MSPFQATLARARAIVQAEAPTVVTNGEHRFLVADQARTARQALRTLYTEPCGRGTAPAIAIAAIELAAQDPEAVMLVMPSDHDIPDIDSFAAAVATGLAAARAGRLVVFGIEPRWPETGYGYIERGDLLPESAGCFHVASFVEKPELEIATRLAGSGRHSWNAGIFLLGASAYLAELEHLEPELALQCRKAAAASVDEAGFRRIDADAFAACTSMSVDHAVLERTQRAALVPATFAWSDIGSWDALWDRAAKDDDGNESHGDVQLHDVADSYFHSSHRLVVGIGVSDVVVVETPDALLVAKRGETQRVRDAVDKLRVCGRGEHRTHRVVHRPWGCYEDVDAGNRFRVKRITVEPGRKLSLQMHHHRAEHWVIVSGTARVTRGDDTMLLTENESIYIPVGELHRLENPGKVPLQLVEVQTGTYLGEDDIVRIDDTWQRDKESAR
jgi:mannose-1-phosphate guanylyltransferase/mannose-6-phosphate isomerase